MRLLYTRTFLLLLLVLNSTSYARTFYVSSTTGDDSRSVAAAQNPNTPWKTLARVNSVPVVSASTLKDTILFKRGDVFIGKLITRAGSATYGNLVYGAYGFGSAPIVTGAVQLGKENGVVSTAWTEVGGGIWRRYYNTEAVTVQSGWPVSGSPTTAAVSQNLSLTALYVNGQRKMISRYPNSGYLFVNTAGTNKAFTAADLGQSDTYFANSKIALRCVPDRWFQARVFVSGTTVNLLDTLEGGSYIARKDAGYYFYGNLTMLDTPGEWYFDEGNDYMYYMPPAGENPNEMDIAASLYDYNVATNEKSYITIKDIAFEKAANTGIYFQNSSYLNFQSLSIKYAYLTTMFSGNGSSAYKSTNIVISDCYFSDSPSGVNFWRTSYSTFTRNTFKRIGTWHIGYLSQYSGAFTSDLGGHRNVYSYNVMDSLGKIGIRICDSLNIIEKNIFSNIGIAAADLAAIYTGDSPKATRGNIIRNNFIFDMRSNTESWKNLPDSYRLLSPGLYNDIYGKNNTWYRNTVYRAGSGILTQNEIQSTFRENVIYDFEGYGMLCIERPSQTGLPVGFANGNNLLSNTFYKKSSTNTSFIFSFENQSADKNWGAFFGTVDSNRYVHSYQTGNYIGIYPHDSYKWLSYTSHWKPKVGDANSKMISNTANSSNPDKSVLFTNMSDNSKTVNLLGTWYDLDGNVAGNSITIDPWYSKILIQGPNAQVLPLDILSFRGNKSSHGVMLHWSTARESNVKSIEIERSGSTTGFSKIASKTPTNKAGESSYSYLDKTPVNGDNYYRLKIIDNDGAFKYSEVVIVDYGIDASSTVQVYPNPNNGKSITVNLGKLTGTKGTLQVLNLLGGVVSRQSFDGSSTAQIYFVNPLASGTYLLRLSNGKDNIVKKILIQ